MTAHPAAELVFWTSAILIAYGYVGYPLLIYLLGRIRRQATIRKEIWPRVSMLVPAFNEGRVIKAKIHNCLRLEYPKERLELLVASDGSSDGTAALIEEATNAGLIRGVVYPERRGKAAVLNDLVHMASGEIIVFSDAASMLEPGSVQALVSNFADARVGCVSGIYRVAGPRRDGDAGQEGAYWRYETFVRLAEARLGTMLGAHGSLYAIRRELFERLDPGVINDDFLIPATILLRGFLSVYDTRAVAREDAREMAGFSRRIRIMTGNYQQLLLLLRKGGWTKRPLLLFQLLSHKALRLLIPFLIVSMYASNAALLASSGYQATFAVQTMFFVAALAGVSPRTRRLGRAPVAAPYYLCMLNVAALVGFYRTVWRKGAARWKAE